MRSLKRRLIVAVMVTTAIGFILAAAWVWRTVSASAARDFETRLSAALSELVLSADIGSDGILTLAREPGDPAFGRPHSGWYWTIAKDTAVLARSRSLRLGDLYADGDRADGEAMPGRGPGGEPLQLRRRTVTLKPSGDLVVTVAGPSAVVAHDIWAAMRLLLAGLAVIAVVLIAVLAFEIEQGLRPLRRFARDIEAASRGDDTRLSPPGYRELDPLSHGINDLIGQVRDVVERARAQSGNLAHAIKTPLSLISARNQQRGEDADADIAASVDVIQRQIDHHLKRARFAGRVRLASQRVPVQQVADDIVLVMQRTYEARGLTIDAEVDSGASFLGEREDLEEMIGNLVENACKWARSRVALAVIERGGSLQITVDDDGGGLSPDLRALALTRGGRLDESVPGSGLGLSIVTDLAMLYSGELVLDASPWGGLRAVLTLPAAGR